MKDFADDCGRIFSFSVFGYNKKLVEKIIDNNQEYDTIALLCGMANGILDIKAKLAKIDLQICEELEKECKKFPAYYDCEECKEELR